MKKPCLIRRKKHPPAPPERTVVVRADDEDGFTYLPPPSGHSLYAMVGEIFMQWTFLEHLLDSCIRDLAGIEENAITVCITAQMMGHGPRCLTIKALARWRGLPDIEKAAERLNNKLYETVELRNRAIHDRILIETKQKAPFRDHRMSKKELHYGLKPFDENEFKQALDLIEERRKDCAALLQLIREQAYQYY